MNEVFELMQTLPSNEWQHVIVCHDGELILLGFNTIEKIDMEWANRILSGEFGYDI